MVTTVVLVVRVPLFRVFVKVSVFGPIKSVTRRSETPSNMYSFTASGLGFMASGLTLNPTPDL